MSTKNGVWHDAKLDPPRLQDNPCVLAVREIGTGEKAYRKYDFCIYISAGQKWNKSGVIYWMPLPKMPEE